MTQVTYDAASRIYPGTDAPAVASLDLHIDDGELLVMVGPSGSGKSTALRMLAGLEPIDDGSVWIGGRDVTLVPPRDRDIAMVFQTYALYPQMTVAANMGFALKQAGVPKEERQRKVQEAARILDLEPYLGRKPKNLSGGQRQRVAIAITLLGSPDLLLLDEPAANLDEEGRAGLGDLVATVRDRGASVLIAAPSPDDLGRIPDRTVRLVEGRLQPAAAPPAEDGDAGEAASVSYLRRAEEAG